jgi:hypothetical protein
LAIDLLLDGPRSERYFMELAIDEARKSAGEDGLTLEHLIFIIRKAAIQGQNACSSG